METYNIEDLYASAWQGAIDEVAEIVNKELGLSLFRHRDWVALESLARNLNIRFNIDGEIIK